LNRQLNFPNIDKLLGSMDNAQLPPLYQPTPELSRITTETN
jgi:hypothetical protein